MVVILAPLLLRGAAHVGIALVGLGNAIVVSTALVMIHDTLGARLVSEIDELVGLRGVVSQAGLRGLHMSAPNESEYGPFAGARSIDLMHDATKGAPIPYGERIGDAVVLSGCNVRVLVSGVPGFCSDQRSATRTSANDSGFRGEMEGALATYSALIKSLQEHEPPLTRGSIEVRELACSCTCGLVIIDDAIARYTPYLPYADTSEMPTLDVVETTGEGLLARYRTMFNTTWTRSKPIFTANFKVPLGDTPMVPI